jgi:CAAX protease family protein
MALITRGFMSLCKYSNIQNIIKNNSQLTLFLKILGILILYALIWFFVLSYFDVESAGNNTVKKLSGFRKVLLLFIIAPVSETLLFQSLVIHLVLKYNKKHNRYFIAIILSTLLFSLTHIYNIYYFLYAIGLGLGFAIFYVIMLNRKSYPIVLTMLLHASFNAAGYFLSPLFD